MIDFSNPEQFNLGQLLIDIAYFLGNLCDWVYKILFTEFKIPLLDVQVNMLTMLFVLGVGFWISVIIIRSIT